MCLTAVIACACLQQELAYEAERYGRAATAAAGGRADGGQGVTSDLATRMAAQQLGTLAGMSVKVCVCGRQLRPIK